MTILGPETIKAIEDHKKAQRSKPAQPATLMALIDEQTAQLRLAALRKAQAEWIERQAASGSTGYEMACGMADNGLGWEDIKVVGAVSERIARMAVFGRGK